MAVEQILVADLLARLAWRIEGRNTADVVIRPNYLWALQSTMREIILDIDLETFRAEAPLVFSDGVRDYPLADDFRRFIEPSLVYTESPFETMWEVPHQDYDRENTAAFLQAKTRPRYFMWLGIHATTGLYQIRVVPTPERTYNARYRYFAYPKRIDQDTDGTTVVDPRFPAAYKDALIAGAMLKFPERVTGQEIQVLSRDLEIWKRTMRRNNRPSIGSTYRRKPFGAYAHHGSGGRRWEGSGQFGSPWNGGSSGPIP